MLWHPLPFIQPFIHLSAAKLYHPIVTSGGPMPGTSDFACVQDTEPKITSQVWSIILAAVPSRMKEEEVGEKKSLLAEYLEDVLGANRQKTSFLGKARKAILWVMQKMERQCKDWMGSRCSKAAELVCSVLGVKQVVNKAKLWHHRFCDKKKNSCALVPKYRMTLLGSFLFPHQRKQRFCQNAFVWILIQAKGIYRLEQGTIRAGFPLQPVHSFKK